MVTRTEAITNFLNLRANKDFANLYNHNMECQVNVAQDGGERIEGDFKGKKWHGWTDGSVTWKSFRIPYKADSNPEYDDKAMSFDLADHAESIGMTGWDWAQRVSKWVAFDFDSIVNHKQGLTTEEMREIVDTIYGIEWVTIRKSTSGKGFHVYVFVDNVSTQNHGEHAALARSILGTMSAITGIDFQTKVDSCGGNMWVWHRKSAGTDGFTLDKQGTILKSVPANWKDHIKVVSGQRRKTLPQNIEDTNKEDEFEELAGQRPRTPLDEEHKRLINFLKETDALWWWDQDHHMLVTHTHYLQMAQNELEFKGFFKTTSEGKDLNSQNCFAFPLRKGSWSIRRYTPGVNEHESWSQDGQGWTRCYLNRDPDLATVCRAFGGLEEERGGFVFREAEIAIKAARYLGIDVKVATAMNSRSTTLKEHKDGRLVVMVDRDPHDTATEMAGWLAKGVKPWTRIYNTQIQAPPEPDINSYDDIIRHLVTETQEDYGWMIKSDNLWRTEPLQHVKLGLQSMGLNSKELATVLGTNIFKCWKVVNKPFQPEYPGDREWNRNAAQIRFLPTQDKEVLNYPTWLKILNHCGKGLDDTIKNNGWAKVNGVLTGADYLKCWIASLFQEPTEPLPYLFFYGVENCGKSIFHEALSMLFTKGYKRADAALISQAGFNAELEGALLCVVEETDLKSNKSAYNRIKDWVTGRELLIHAKGRTPYHVLNTTHWCQCSNDHEACPIFPGDTRITMCYVEELDPIDLIPKKNIMPILEKEAPDFLAEILNLEIPVSNDRLNVPTINTIDKVLTQEMNQSAVQTFLRTACQYAPGYKIKLSELYSKFINWVSANDPNQFMAYSKIKFGREIPPQYPKGRDNKDAQHYRGNITWSGEEIQVLTKLVVDHKGFLVSDD